MKVSGLVAKYLTEDEIGRIASLAMKLKNKGTSNVEYVQPYVLGYRLALHRMNRLINNDN